MKKILLLSLLLGLSGCGDNNQSDTSQSNAQAQILQQAEVTPIVANYSLASSPRAMSAVAPLQGWSITNSIVMGASTLIDAIKDAKVSATLVTPNATQVANVLRGGAAGVALSLAVDQLLDAVDWVLDPANNRIVYKVQPTECELNHTCVSPNDIRYYHFTGYDGIQRKYSNPLEGCRGIRNYFGGMPVIRVDLDGDNSGLLHKCVVSENGAYQYIIRSAVNIDYNPKTLPLEVVAEQVISNADAGSLDAQVATNIAVQNILNDAEQAEPVVQDLENNANNNCPSGIVKNGSCWICERDQYYPMSRATRDAKTATRGKSCKDLTDTTIKSANAILFRNLINARVLENACWSPPDPNHVARLAEDRIALSYCEN
ncbi:hypothetical protein NGC85_05935 [Acinetobacter sp. Z1]|uniref:hypothetical protein n=1 Tax=Acinetobacter sp. Z1 TaxID=2953738 RepID=UPI0020C9DFBB|nr:hypothetical protein [Acinetobacter sp. Z1]UTO20621.1 hypothetical protein NGC85_05935 [Acinetobacter sp. Z1]